MVSDSTFAVLVRAPASPPGRTVTVMTGQVEPATQTGRLAMSQVSKRLVPPEAAVPQVMPLAEFSAMLSLI